MMIRNTVAILGVIFSSGSSATSLVDREVDVLLEKAVSAFEGEVVGISAECDKKGCFSEITVLVGKVHKGFETRKAKASFCSSAPLIIGFKYIFFVDAAGGGVKRSRCSEVVERDAVFSRFDDSVYRYMSPGSFNAVKVDGVEYLTGWVLVKEFDLILSK